MRSYIVEPIKQIQCTDSILQKQMVIDQLILFRKTNHKIEEREKDRALHSSNQTSYNCNQLGTACFQTRLGNDSKTIFLHHIFSDKIGHSELHGQRNNQVNSREKHCQQSFTLRISSLQLILFYITNCHEPKNRSVSE